jgi:glycosyltransferase involved in cell wall biosynthesis
MAEDLFISYGFSKDQLTTIHNPVNQAFLSVLEEGVGSSAKDKDDESPHEILFVGRLSEQKGLHWLIEAVEQLSRVRDDFVVRLVGRGPEEEALKQTATDCDVVDYIRFEGYQTDIISYYRQASCTVLTSRFEGFPNVLVESTAVGTPVVSFDCPSGPREIIQPNVNGRLVPMADTDQLATALSDTLDHAWDRGKIRESAMRYHPEQILDRYEHVVSAP